MVCGVWRSVHGAGGRSYQSALSPGSTQRVEGAVDEERLVSRRLLLCGLYCGV